LKHITKRFHRIIRRKQLHDCPFLRWCDVKMSEAFFAISSSSVFCPSNRSSSRIRSLFSSKRRSCPKACAAFSRNCAFQEANNCGLIWCSRQTSAAVLAPLKTSSTTRALNSALNARRFRMTFPFLGLILLHLQTCPSFGAHYRIFKRVVLHNISKSYC